MNDVIDIEKTKITIEVWKQSIEVQQHFNEICMKIRNFYISFVTALLALIGVIVSRVTDPFFKIGNFDVHITLPVLVAIIIATYLFYFIDRHWYHRLLFGAVKNATEIERQLMPTIPGIGLTTKIGDNSPLDVSSWKPGSLFIWAMGLIFGGDKRVRTEHKIHSDAKISMFYKGVASLFLVIFVFGAISGGVKISTRGVVEASNGEKTIQTDN